MLNKTKVKLSNKLLILFFLLYVCVPVLSVSSAGVGSISGQITGNNGILSGVVVTTYLNGVEVTNSNTTTDSNGQYVIPSLPYATYDVRFHDPNGYYEDFNESIALSQNNININRYLSTVNQVDTYFFDTNDVANQISGIFSWHPFANNTTVSYAVYFLRENNSIISNPYIGTATSYNVTNAPSEAKKIGVQAISSTGNTRPILSTRLWDNGTLVPYDSLAFYDTNTAPNLINAKITWSKAQDESQIDKYLLHVFYNNQRILIGEIPKLGITAYTYTLLNFPTYYTSIELSAQNSLGEESPPFSNNVSDNTFGKLTLTANQNSSLGVSSSSFFNDTDPQLGTIGGYFYWNEPAVSTSIYSYEAYYLDASGNKLSSLGTVKKTAYTGYRINIEKNTALNMNSNVAKQIAIYAQDVNGAEGPPRLIELVDSVGGTPRNLSFYDTDQSLGQITGTLYWNKAIDESDIIGYNVYYTDDAKHIIGSPLNTQLLTKGSSSYHLTFSNQSTLVGNINATRLAVVSMNASNQPDKTETLPIWDDNYFRWNNAVFLDNDGTPGTINAVVNWTHYGNETGFLKYVVFYKDSSGQIHSIGTVPKTGSSTYSFPLTPDITNNLPTAIGSIHLGYINAYNEISPYTTYLTYADNTMNGTIPIIDRTNLPKPINLSFYDQDYNANFIGGQLRWKAPSTDSVSVSYAVYFVTEQGVKIKPIATINRANNVDFSINLPNGTGLPSLNGTPAAAIGIYAYSGGLETNNPALYMIWDSKPNASLLPNSNMVDTNGTEGLITAQIHWSASTEQSRMLKYTISYRDNNYNFVKIAEIPTVPNVTEYTYTLTSAQFTGIPANSKILYLNFDDLYGNAGPQYYDLQLSDLTANKTNFVTVANESLKPVDILNSNIFYPGVSGNYFAWWNNPTDSTNITEYEIYYLNKDGQKVGSLVKIKKSDYDFTNAYIPNTVTAPASASKLAVFSKNANGEESKKYAVIPLYSKISGALDPNNEGIGIDKILKFISGDGSFRREDIQYLLEWIDPIIVVNNPT
jgi:hypothetical protein